MSHTQNLSCLSVTSVLSPKRGGREVIVLQMDMETLRRVGNARPWEQGHLEKVPLIKWVHLVDLDGIVQSPVPHPNP